MVSDCMTTSWLAIGRCSGGFFWVGSQGERLVLECSDALIRRCQMDLGVGLCNCIDVVDEDAGVTGDLLVQSDMRSKGQVVAGFRYSCRGPSIL